MKKRTLFRVMTALMIAMTSGGRLTAVYADEIPTEADFMNSIADYLTFEFNMVTHGKGYLFGQKGGDGNA